MNPLNPLKLLMTFLRKRRETRMRNLFHKAMALSDTDPDMGALQINAVLQEYGLAIIPIDFEYLVQKAQSFAPDATPETTMIALNRAAILLEEDLLREIRRQLVDAGVAPRIYRKPDDLNTYNPINK